jgi:tripartite-type tricarboxylate transporter receptor subunit TctC
MTVNIVRRSLLAAALFAAGAVSAQTWPNTTIKIVVPFPPGGSVDMVARAVGKQLSDTLKQPVVVDNRAGASGNIAAEYVARQPADGYTLFVTSSGVLAANQFLYKHPGFETLKDFTPVIGLVNQPNILLVHPSVEAKSVQDLIALAKAHPGKISMGNAGVGTGQDLAARAFSSMAGVKVLHVSYKGGAPAMNDLLGGQIQAMFQTAPEAVPYLKDGKVRALAITSPKRSQLLPNLPTVAEAGIPGYESSTWIGMVVPANTPKTVVAKLNEVLNTALKGQMGKQFSDYALDPMGGSPENMTSLIRKDTATYQKIFKEAGVEPQ